MKERAKMRCLACLSILLVVMTIVYVLFVYIKKSKTEDTYKELRQEAVEEDASQTKHDFDKLREKNPDIYSWIMVPNTDVDYPVLQSEEDNYYLSHDVDKKEATAGAIYSNACNSTNNSDVITILYGHDMKNGTMFASLHQFDEEEFFEDNTEIFLEDPKGMGTYKIYGVFNYNDDYIPAKFDLISWVGEEAFLASLKACAEEGNAITHVRDDVKIASGDKLLVLSTCISGQDDRRFLVVAVLDNYEEY